MSRSHLPRRPSFSLSACAAALAGGVALGCSSPSTPAPDEACPAPPGEGVTHAADVTSDETWRAADGPHRVEGRVAVRDGATLTIEPCAEVQLAPGASLDAGVQGTNERGRIVALGEAERPIAFSPSDDGAWSSLGVFAPSEAELAHATLRGGGSDAFRDHATVYVVGGGVVPSQGTLAVDHVAVEGSAGHGVVLAGAASFAAGSAELSISGSGTAHPGFPMVIGQHAIDALPSGDLRGNAIDEILVREDLANGYVGLQTDATMRALSVPYRIGTEDGEPMRIGSSAGTGFATLTIEPGVELRFHPGTMLRILSSPDAPVGAIVARGTAEAPVRFTSGAAAPAPGDWAGLYFESPVAASNEIGFVTIKYAGGYCSCVLSSCSPIEYSEAAIVFDGGAPPSAFVHDTAIRMSAGHGIFRSWLDAADVDFSATNTFEGIAGCNQTVPVLSDVVCPSEDYACAAP